MKLCDKIVALRKARGMSQEALAESLGLSRQAVSRWEMGTALPDATNLLQLSRLFEVSADYLLNEDYHSDQDLPPVRQARDGHFKQIFIALLTLEAMVLLMQYMSIMVLQSTFFGVFSFIPFVGLIGGFEYAYHKRAGEATAKTAYFRKRFYQASAWLGLYFPLRLVLDWLVRTLYPRPMAGWFFNVAVLVVYIVAAAGVTLLLEKKTPLQNSF